MLLKRIFVFTILLLVVATTCVEAEENREWTDASGHYQFTARMIAYDNQHVVLEKENKELISISIEQLSEKDQKHLSSVKANEATSAKSNSSKTWTMQGGLKVKAIVIDFGEREVKLERPLRGKIYVNDRVITNLPAVYQAIIPKIVEHFEGMKFKDNVELEAWLKKQPRGKKSYKCQGVILELESGDRYGVPFFLFVDMDQTILKNGFKRWQAAIDDQEKQEKEAFYLRAQADANTENIERMRQIAEVNIRLQAYDAGLFDLWEVALLPPSGNYYRAKYVVVPGRNSDEAANAALQQYPGARVGSIAKVRRKGRR